MRTSFLRILWKGKSPKDLSRRRRGDRKCCSGTNVSACHKGNVTVITKIARTVEAMEKQATSYFGPIQPGLLVTAAWVSFDYSL